MEREGIEDSIEWARTHMQHRVVDRVPQDRQDAYIEYAREMATCLEALAEMEFTRMDGYSNYYPERPGGMSEGRDIEPRPFDGRK